jgi:PAS domain S-box-containing protein
VKESQWPELYVNTRLRQLAPVGVVLVLTAVGFVTTRALGELDARHESSRRAEIAATQVRDRIAQATSLMDGIRRFLAARPAGVATEQFTDIGARWLAPVGLPAAAWIERVAADGRAGYERQRGHTIVTATPSGELVHAGPRKTYLPATLVTGSPPLSAPGIDLGGLPGVADAVERPETAYGASATSLRRDRDGTTGLFLVQSAPRLDRGIVEPGYAVLFVPASWLLAGPVDTGGSGLSAVPALKVTVGGGSAGDFRNAPTAGSTFTADGQRFAVFVPRSGVHGAAEVLSWMVAAGGLLLAALAGVLEAISARRARAKAEVDRLFGISPDLIVVSGFDGYFKRVNPTFETVLGYSEQEALTRPLIEFVHPDDRARTDAERRRLREGETTISFENRYVCKNGSSRWIEWTAVAVVAERLTYAVGRDVTGRRQTETDLRTTEERNRVLAEGQAALRRVATLVARRVPPAELFAAVTEEAGRLLSVEFATLGRYESDSTLTILAAWSRTGVVSPPVGSQRTLGGKNLGTLVFETGRPARMDSYADASGPLGVAAYEEGAGSGVGSPIVVEGRLWGLMTARSKREQPLPADTEARLASFTDLVATAVANAENRAQLARLAEEQAALRRVATLVAEGVPPAKVLAAVGEEVNALLDAQNATIARLDEDGKYTVVANCGTTADALAVGTRHTPEPGWVVTAVIETRRPARKDNDATAAERIPLVIRDLGVRSSVAAPIVVEGALWGVVIIGTVRKRFPDDTERRLEEFTELAATAIANAQARAEVSRLAEEQAALRRVATLVAREASPAEVFSAVTEEVGRLIGADIAALVRLESANRAIVVAAWSEAEGDQVPVGTPIPLEGENVATKILRTARPARTDHPEAPSGPTSTLVRRLGVTSTVGTPIVVEGRLWGGMSVSSKHPGPLPVDTESRIADFAELVATAIANADARTELTASRARIVAAADETRRRIERDLHDGTQQRLVSLGLELRLAESTVSPELEEARTTIRRVAGELTRVIDELREISRGIHPAILSEGGLGPALRTLGRRSAIPVVLGDVVEDRLPEPIEVAAYYVVSEALTNAAKHANASRVDVEAVVRDRSLRLSIGDDGIGGANAVGGSGLIGLRDRVEALGGTIELESPPGRGTHLVVLLPLELDPTVDEPAGSRSDRVPAAR